MCPNNDGGTSLPSNARIKVFVRDQNNLPIANIAAADICVLFNGGTTAQGFSGTGADSVISNTATNPLCPDLRCVAADAPTNSGGITYITFGGALSTAPGTYVRNSNRKWGHYDTVLPVYVLGFQLNGRLTQASANGTYALQIKSYDFLGGLGAGQAGEAITSTDFNSVANNANPAAPGYPGPIGSYWRDFDNLNNVSSSDFNVVAAHISHTCVMGVGQPPTSNP
jgi:hypothetical protein